MAQVRIKDIAQRAGVSVGTVDRVLHDRGQVSKVKEERIKQAIKELNYQPNLAARILATGVSYRIATITPSSEEDAFWKAQLEGMERATNYIKDFGFEVDNYEFNDQIKGSLLALKSDIFLGNYDALVIAPTMKDEGSEFLDICDLHQIPYVQINSFLERGSQYASGYVGQDSFQSGTLAAKLLDLSTHRSATFAILHMEKDVATGEHMVKKEKGFNHYFTDYNELNHNVVTQWIPQFNNKEEVLLSISDLLNRHKNLLGVFVTTSRCHHVVKALLKLKRADITIVGYDLIRENIEALHSYKRLFLINQNPSLQGYYGLRNFFDRFIKKKTFIKERYLPLDVVTLENIRNYIHVVERDNTTDH